MADTFPADLTCSWTSVTSGGASGNTNDSGISLGDTLSLLASSSVTYTVSCDIDSDATGTLSNTATATASVTDNTPTNNSATDNDTHSPTARVEGSGGNARRPLPRLVVSSGGIGSGVEHG